MVCLQSTVLAAQADSSSTGIIDLAEDQAELVESMLQFLYFRDYSEGPHPLLFNAKMYAIAQKYEIPALEHLAARKYENTLETDWDTSQFVESLRFTHERASNTDELKEIAIHWAGLKAKTLAEEPAFADLCRERGDIGHAVLQASLHQRGSGESIRKTPPKEDRGHSTFIPHFNMGAEDKHHKVKAPQGVCAKCGMQARKSRGYKAKGWYCEGCNIIF